MNTADILAEIECADDILINDIIRAVTRRYEQVHPEWEICFLALPKNDPVCRKAYVSAIAGILHNDEL